MAIWYIYGIFTLAFHQYNVAHFRQIFAIGLGVTAVLTLVTPWAANAGIGTLIAVRVVQGLFEGATFPCIQVVWSKWAPPLERSRMAAISYAGTYVGTVVALPGSGWLATAYGWQSLFYVFGTIGCVWFVLWMLIVRESPEQDRNIGEDELQYIQKSLGRGGADAATSYRHPWRSIFTSPAVLAICAAHFSENWGFYTLLTQLPTFLKGLVFFGFLWR